MTDSRPLFVYGTLLFPEVLSLVVGRIPRQQALVLAGYRRCRLQQRVYPGLVPHEGAATEGIVLEDLSPAELHRLDEYEDFFYERRAVDVHATPGVCFSVWAYVVGECGFHLIEEDDWNPEDFAERDLKPFLERLGA